MKSLRVFLLVGLAVLATGCGEKKLTCTKTDTKGGKEVKATIVVKAKDDKISYMKQTAVNEVDSSSLDTSLKAGELISEQFKEIDGMSMEYKKVDDTHLEMTMEIDYAKIKVEQLREKLGDTFDEEDFLKEKDMTLDQFKEENLDGFECK